MFKVAQHPRWSLGRILGTSVTTIEAIKSESQQEVTGAIASPTDHRTSYPGGGVSEVIMAAAIPTFRPARSASNHENLANGQKNGGYPRDLDSCTTASLLLFSTWRLRVFSAHPRHPESDSFLSCATKKKRGWRRRARDSANLRSRLRASLFVGWALCDTVCSSSLFRIIF